MISISNDLYQSDIFENNLLQVKKDKSGLCLQVIKKSSLTFIDRIWIWLGYHDTYIQKITNTLNSQLNNGNDKNIISQWTLGKTSAEINNLINNLSLFNLNVQKHSANAKGIFRRKAVLINETFLQDLRANLNIPKDQSPSRLIHKLFEICELSKTVSMVGCFCFLMIQCSFSFLGLNNQIPGTLGLLSGFIFQLMFPVLNFLKEKHIQKVKDYITFNSIEKAIGKNIVLNLVSVDGIEPSFLPIRNINKRHKIAFQRISNIVDILNAINKAKRLGNNIKTLVIHAHGLPQLIGLDKNSYIDNNNVHQLENSIKKLDPEAVIILDSCLTGKEMTGIDNIAQRIARIAGGRKVFCPDSVIATGKTEMFWDPQIKVLYGHSLLGSSLKDWIFNRDISKVYQY